MRPKELPEKNNFAKFDGGPVVPIDGPPDFDAQAVSINGQQAKWLKCQCLWKTRDEATWEIQLEPYPQ